MPEPVSQRLTVLKILSSRSAWHGEPAVIVHRLGIKVKATLGISSSAGNARGRQIKDVSAFYEILMSKRVCRARARGFCSRTESASDPAVRERTPVYGT